MRSRNGSTPLLELLPHCTRHGILLFIMAAATIGRLRSIIVGHHPAALMTFGVLGTASEPTRHITRGTRRNDELRAMKIGEKKVVRGEHPSYLKWMCITSSITGDFPLTDILQGRPNFRWFTFPTLMFFVRIFLAMIGSYCWVGVAGKSFFTFLRFTVQDIRTYQP